MYPSHSVANVVKTTNLTQIGFVLCALCAPGLFDLMVESIGGATGLRGVNDRPLPRGSGSTGSIDIEGPAQPLSRGIRLDSAADQIRPGLIRAEQAYAHACTPTQRNESICPER
jgi:hypothetical protein